MRKQPNLLEVVRKKRGYLLSCHRLLYDIHPRLLAAYDAFYTRYTLAAVVAHAGQRRAADAGRDGLLDPDCKKASGSSTVP
jgi:hypothetical protein